MELTIQPVDATNREDVLGLTVHPGQQGFIETPAACLQDAADYPEFRPVGLYADEVLVGFAMYGALRDSAGGRNVWMDRLLIDAQYQGEGLGRSFTRLLLERLEQEYGRQPIYLSVFEENLGARRLYESFGFEFIHEYDADGEWIYRKT
ncbi:GNAT family N-acetyltransferase [Sporosarcina koreensis]|uniref:GNAT family N-acetyltransferase n=1 Tax=Sporosarcina koreensis TaxID=334735 RepID=UPI0005902B12|nr:GNAT family N-acetyltransferase [Sporosarcina koreensis]